MSEILKWVIQRVLIVLLLTRSLLVWCCHYKRFQDRVIGPLQIRLVPSICLGCVPMSEVLHSGILLVPFFLSASSFVRSGSSWDDSGKTVHCYDAHFHFLFLVVMSFSNEFVSCLMLSSSATFVMLSAQENTEDGSVASHF